MAKLQQYGFQYFTGDYKVVADLAVIAKYCEISPSDGDDFYRMCRDEARSDMNDLLDAFSTICAQAFKSYYYGDDDFGLVEAGKYAGAAEWFSRDQREKLRLCVLALLMAASVAGCDTDEIAAMAKSKAAFLTGGIDD